MSQSTPKKAEASGAVPQTTASQRRWILLATSLGLLAVMVSVSGLNVAQQALAADIGASQSQLLWIINGFTVALAATLLPLGALGDRVGRKMVLVAGLAAFAGLNLASAFAGDPVLLIGLRIAMGVAAALIMPTTLSTITAAFPPEERGRAVGVWTGVAGGGGVIGLISSAILIDYASWQWVFAAPILVALTALAITIPMVPNSHEPAEGRFDLVGSFISLFAVGGIVLGIHEGPEQGWSAPITVASIATGVIALVGFILWENRQRFPLLDISVFKNRNLSAGALSLTVMFALIIGMFLVMIQFLQAVLGFSAIRSAIAMLPMMGGLMFISPISPRIAARLGYRTTMIGALLAATASLGWMALVPDSPSYTNVLPGLVLLGLALGVAMTPSTTAITESLPADKQGVASALNDTVREVGGAIGVALIGSILAAGYRDGISDTADSLDPEVGRTVQEGIGGALSAAGQLEPDSANELIGSAQEAFMNGWGNAMTFAAAIAFATAVIAARLIPRETPSTRVPVANVPAALVADDAPERTLVTVN